MSSKETHTTAPRPLWLIARTLICDFFNLFGEPQDIARQAFITAHTRALMLTWLRACETVLRHLLLIEAAAILPTLPPSDTHATVVAGRVHAALGRVSRRNASFRCCLDRRRPRRRDGAYPSKRVRVSRHIDSTARYFIDEAAAAIVRANKAAWLAEMNASCVETLGSPALRGGAVARRAPEGAPATRAELHSPWPLAERTEALLRAFNAPAPHARRLAFRLRRTPRQARLMLRVPADIDRALDRESVTELHNAALPRCPTDDSS